MIYPEEETLAIVDRVEAEEEGVEAERAVIVCAHLAVKKFPIQQELHAAKLSVLNAALIW